MFWVLPHVYFTHTWHKNEVSFFILFLKITERCIQHSGKTLQAVISDWITKFDNKEMGRSYSSLLLFCFQSSSELSGATNSKHFSYISVIGLFQIVQHYSWIMPIQSLPIPTYASNEFSFNINLSYNIEFWFFSRVLDWNAILRYYGCSSCYNKFVEFLLYWYRVSLPTSVHALSPPLSIRKLLIIGNFHSLSPMILQLPNNIFSKPMLHAATPKRCCWERELLVRISLPNPTA